MALLIKTNKFIQGIKLGKVQTPEVITQFADDMGLYLVYLQVCLEATIDTLTHIEINTGLLISYEKMNIYRIGSLKNSNAQLYTQKPLNWSNDDISMLGILIANDAVQTNKQYNQIIEKMKLIAKQWSGRSLPLLGKILVVNTLMSSLFIHAMLVLTCLSEEQLRTIDEIIKSFLWKGKAKIPLRILRRTKKEGGQQLTDFHLRYLSLQARWVKKAVFDTTFNYASEWLCPILGKLIWYCNINEADLNCMICTFSSWKQI